MDTLKTLSNLTGVSGYENIISEKIKELLSKYCDNVYIDTLGNVVGVKKSKKKNPFKILLAAHMDEIGLIVTDIDEKGFIHFTTVGGIDTKILPAKEVIVHGKEDLFGVIGAKPPHLLQLDERDKPTKIENMVIDIGFKAEKAKQLVSIGDVITFNISSNDLLNNFITGKSLDNRAGVATILECLKQLEDHNIDAEVYAVATVQEEVGSRGAVVSSYDINPDIGIAIDTGFAFSPYTSEDEAFEASKGCIVTIGPNIHPKLSKKLMDTAKEYNVPIQLEVEAGNTGTDAWAIQIARSGIPTLLVSIPIRYMHTMVETCNVTDVKNAGKLLAFLIMQLKGDLKQLLCY